MEALFAKLAAPLWETLKWLGAALLGLLIWIWKRQDADIKSLKITVSEMRENVVYKADLDDQADRIREEVKDEHQKIVDAVKDIHGTMRDDLINCNQSLMTEIRDLRGFLMNHLERRGTPRGKG
jgi:hypothetical protein